jgi:tight adherence protein C
MFLVLALACLAGAAFLIGEVATQPARERRESVDRASSYGRVAVEEGDSRPFKERVLLPFSQRLASTVLRISPKTSLETVSLKLLSAGLPWSTNAFLSIKGISAVTGFLFGVVFGAALLGPLGAVLCAAVFTLGGWTVPEYAVSLRVRSRREKIRSELPDALDLLAVSVEAGLGFDGAITKITEHMEGSLSDEFALTLGEIRVGETRAEALKKMALRTAAPEVASFVRSIIQADQLGISLGRILRVQAADTRLRRQAAAEERAMKAPIKMLFPTVLFIFPSMFIVILGPAMLNFLTLFHS